ncbi:putative ABC transporter [Trypanosoma vivax]|nr:putative ABC transporter [Trypanosoma vivax]
MRKRTVNVLAVSIVFSMSVGLVVRALSNKYRAGLKLRARVVLVAEAEQILDTWEVSCLCEVKEWLNSAYSVRDRNGKSTYPFHGPVRSLAYAPTVDLCQWLRLWRSGRALCASTTHDMLVFERLAYLIKYIAFRRLASMAEARYYASAWRYSVHSGGETETVYKPHMPPWLIGRRPFWIVPLDGADTGRLLCLPLSYFPIETILTCTAEETWVHELVKMSPLLTGRTRLQSMAKTLQQWCRITGDCFTRQKSLSAVRQPLWENIDVLFAEYAVPLAISQIKRREIACVRFYNEKMFEGVELVSGDGVDMEEGLQGPFSVPSSSLHSSVYGRDVLLRKPEASYKLQCLLKLRLLSHATRVLLSILEPQGQIVRWLLFPALSITPTNSEKLGNEAIILEFSKQIIRASASAVVRAFVRFIGTAVKSKICKLLRDELCYEVRTKLATVDEAFLRRCLEEGEFASSTCSPVSKLLSHAEKVASQMVSHFDQEESRRMTWIAVFIFAWWRHEVDVALFATLAAFLDLNKFFQAMYQCIGVTSRESDYEEECLGEKPLPPKKRYGLRVLMSILAEKEEQMADRTAPRPSTAGSWPFLSIVVCGGTFVLDWPIDSLSNSEVYAKFDKRPRNRSGVGKGVDDFIVIKKLFDRVVGIEQPNVGINWISTFVLQKCESSLVMSLRLDAACIREYILPKYGKDSSKTNDFGKNCWRFDDNSDGVTVSRTVISSEEVKLLDRGEAMGHIPQLMSFDNIFDKGPRFVLRQLGLEAVFAYGAAISLRHNDMLSIGGPLCDFVSSAARNILYQLSSHLGDFMEALLFYSLLSYRMRSPLIWRLNSRNALNNITSNGTSTEDDYFATSATLWTTSLLLDRMRNYRAMLSEGENHILSHPVRLIQQVVRYLPVTVHDTAPLHYTTRLKNLRRLWAETLPNNCDLEFDDAGRITGGYKLRGGAEFRGIYFAYPQLMHHPVSGSVLPVLSDVSIRLPAGGITVIVGPTGSGKSTLLRLLTRLYEPVIALTEDEESGTWLEYRGLIQIIKRCLDARLPEPTNLNANNVIFIDGIPLCCFSAAYLQRAIGVLDQTPHIFKGLTFLQNMSLCCTNVSIKRATLFAQLCYCEEFVHRHPLGYDAPVGNLSAGEKQRLALAQAMMAGCYGLGLVLLDEPTSCLDGQSSAHVEKALEIVTHSEENTTTVVVISHRISMAQTATNVAVLVDGRLEYQGPGGKHACDGSLFVLHAVKCHTLSSSL